MLAILPLPELTIVEKPQPDVIQIPLPDPATIPAWVHMALDRWDTSHATYYGYDILRQIYPELHSSYDNPLERQVYRKLRVLALCWQRAGYRTYITSFEKQILDAEIKALENPLSSRRGDMGIQLDMEWILSFIQSRLGSYRVAMGKRHILATLDGISAIYTVCETMGIEVKMESSERTPLRNVLQRRQIA